MTVIAQVEAYARDVGGEFTLDDIWHALPGRYDTLARSLQRLTDRGVLVQRKLAHNLATYRISERAVAERLSSE